MGHQRPCDQLEAGRRTMEERPKHSPAQVAKKVTLYFCSYPARALRALGLLLADGTPTGGRGEDFLSRQPDFFTETAVTPEQKVEKSIPRWEINRHSEGYKWNGMANIGFFGQKPRFWAQKKAHFCTLTMFWPQSEKSCSKKTDQN